MDDVEVWQRLPLNVEMVSWLGGNPSKLTEFTGGKFRVVDGTQVPVPLRGGVPASAQVYDELHGSWVFVWLGDRIVRGVKGEFYPIESGALGSSYRKPPELIGPLTAEEWAEFRWREQHEDEGDFLYCCANTSALRDSIFRLLRNGGARGNSREFVETFNMVFPGYHSLEEMGERGGELLTKLRDYYIG